MYHGVYSKTQTLEMDSKFLCYSESSKNIHGQKFCDLKTILHLFYLIFHAISPAQCIFFQYIVSFQAIFDQPFCAVKCEPKSK